MTDPATNPITTAALTGYDAATTQAITAANNLLGALRSAYVARDAETLCLVLALICEEHVLLLGPPGTGKTHMATTFSKALGIAQDDLFTYLLGKFTQPDELLGAINLPAMKQGIMKRVTTNKLPEAKVAILDEIFKGNSSILNSLLTLLNERAFDNPTRQACPLQVAVGLSNELPEGGPKGHLGALYDRFLFRRWVSYIDTSTTAGAASWASLMLGGSAPRIACQLDPADVQALRQARALVDVAPVIGTVLTIKTALEDGHGITISDRRWGKALKAVQANAVLNGRSVANADDLQILADCLWDEPSERPAIDLVIAQHADPGYAAAVEQSDIAQEAFASVPGVNATDEAFGAAAGPASRTILDAVREISKLPQSHRVAATLVKCEKMAEAIQRAQNTRMGW